MLWTPRAKRARAESEAQERRAENQAESGAKRERHTPVNMLIGRRVSIRWTGDPGNPWFDGAVAGWRASGEHRIKYDDGESKWHDLGEEEEHNQLRWLSSVEDTPAPTSKLCGTPGCTLPDFHDGPCSCHTPPPGAARARRPASQASPWIDGEAQHGACASVPAKCESAALLERIAALRAEAEAKVARVQRVWAASKPELAARVLESRNVFTALTEDSCGRGLFARRPLSAQETICEYGGPILPLVLLPRGEYVLEVPERRPRFGIDGNAENSPFADAPRYPGVFANHSCRPNAKLEFQRAASPGRCDLKGRMYLVAREPIAAGQEVRFDYEGGHKISRSRAPSYWRGQPPVETGRWRGARAAMPKHPLPEGDERPKPLAWVSGSGDERLRALVQLLVPGGGSTSRRRKVEPGGAWGRVATHMPGRSGEECLNRWRVLTGASEAAAGQRAAAGHARSGDHEGGVGLEQRERVSQETTGRARSTPTQ